jgi:hypothetical protein
MRRTMIVALSAVVLLVLASLGSFVPSSNAVTSPPARVIILICSANFASDPPPIQVEASDSSVGNPPAPGTSCAQGLADALSAGFTIKDVQPAFNGGGALYTLVK